MTLRGLTPSVVACFTLLGAAVAWATPAPRSGLPITEAATWTPRTGDGLQPARAGASAVFDQARNRVIVFGGSAGAFRNDTWALDLNTNRWTQLATTGINPSPREWHTATIDASGHMIVYGGWDGRHLNDMYSLDLTTLVWRRLTVSARSALSAPLRYQHSSALVTTQQDTALYIFGGYDGDSLSNAVYRYVLGSRDPRNTNTWSFFTTVANSKPPIRRGGATLVVDYAPTDTFLVVFGGTDGTRFFNSGGRLSLSSAEWDTSFIAVAGRPSIRTGHASAYDPATRTLTIFGGWNGGTQLADAWSVAMGGTAPVSWSQRTVSGAAPSGRADAASCVANGKLLVIGGTTTAGLNADTWSLPLSGGDWSATALSAAPGARFGHALVLNTASGKNLLYGGSSSYKEALSDVWEYDAAAGTWTNLNVPPPIAGEKTHAARIRAAVAYAGGTHDALYAFGGFTGAYDDTMWVLSPATATWRKVPAVGPAKRESATLSYDAARDRLILFGGFNGTYLSDLWAFNLASETWTQLPSLLGAGRAGHVAAINNAGLLVVAMGRGTSGLLSEIRTFDLTAPTPTSSTWQLVAESGTRPLPRMWAAAASIGNTVYLYGGAGPSASASAPLLSVAYGDTIFALAAGTFTWSVAGSGLAVNPGSRLLSAMAPSSTTGRLVLYGGGSDGSPFGDTWTVAVDGGSAPSATASVMSDGSVAVRWKIDPIAPSAGFTVLRSNPSGEETVVAVVSAAAHAGNDGWMQAYDVSTRSGTYRYTVLDLSTGARVVAGDVVVPDLTFTGVARLVVRTPARAPLALSFAAPNMIAARRTPTHTPEVVVFDPAGRIVNRVALVRDGANRYAAVWDGRDDRGHDVPSGVYLLRATGDYGDTAGGRLILTR